MKHEVEDDDKDESLGHESSLDRELPVELPGVITQRVLTEQGHMDVTSPRVGP